MAFTQATKELNLYLKGISADLKVLKVDDIELKGR